MTSEELTSFVTRLAPELVAVANRQFPEFVVAADKIHGLARQLKDDADTQMDYLFCLTAADRKDGLHVIYHLTSSVYRHSLVLRVILPDKNTPVVPTVGDVWKAAEFYEREVFDLFGIVFQNHPDLRRIFLDDDWAGFPLRKDYKDSFTLEA